MSTQPAVLDDLQYATRSNREPEPNRPALTRIEVILLGGFEVRRDGHVSPSDHWSRRYGVAQVKLLALSPGCQA